MKKSFFLLLFLLLAACTPTRMHEEKLTSNPPVTQAQAREVAEQSCIKGGEALSEGQYDSVAGVWRFEANLNSDTAECKSWCVVKEKNGTAQMERECDSEADLEIFSTPVVPKNHEGKILLECTGYQNFRSQEWYADFAKQLEQKDRLDAQEAEFIRMASSSYPADSVEQIIKEHGKIAQADIVVLCPFGQTEGFSGLVLTESSKQGMSLFTFDASSEELVRAKGAMINPGMIESIQREGDLIVITTASYFSGENEEDFWGKVFHYDLKTNTLSQVESCKMENGQKVCEKVNFPPSSTS